MGQLDFRKALELTTLIALADRDHGRRAAIRRYRWWIGAREPGLEEAQLVLPAQLVLSALSALGGPAHKVACRAVTSRPVRSR